MAIPVVGVDDGVGGGCFFCSEYDVLCFFCRHQRRRRLPYSPSLQSVQGRTPACGNRSPHQKGGAGGHPYSLAYFPLCFVVVRRSLGHALNVRSLFRAFHASPTEKYTALTHIRAYTRNRLFAYQPQVTRRC